MPHPGQPRSDVVQAPYGIDHNGQPFIDVANPYVQGWIRGDRNQITVYPELSGGIAYVDPVTGELVVRG